MLFRFFLSIIIIKIAFSGLNKLLEDVDACMTRRGSEKPNSSNSHLAKGALEKTKKKNKVIHENLSQQPTMVLVLVFIFSEERVFF